MNQSLLWQDDVCEEEPVVAPLLDRAPMPEQAIDVRPPSEMLFGGAPDEYEPWWHEWQDMPEFADWKTTA